MRIRLVKIDDHGTHEIDWEDPTQRKRLREAAGVHIGKRLIGPLAKRGIFVVKPGEKFDVTLTSHLSMRLRHIRRWDEGPLLIHDHHDMSNLSPTVRHLLGNDIILGILKPRVYRDPKMYNRRMTRGAWHTTLAVKSLPRWFPTQESLGLRDPIIPVDLAQVKKKVRLVPGYSHSHRFRAGWNIGPQIDAPRCFDAYFCGTVVYGNMPITMHRIEFINAMRSAKQRGLSVRWLMKEMRWDHYMAVGVRQAKITPSPWGYGAVCFRDFEAIMGGSLLVKPDTSFCQTWPDLFDPDGMYYVKCRPDHKNLADIIDDISVAWGRGHYKDIRTMAWELLRRHHDLDVTADYMAGVFHYFKGLL